MQLHRTHKKPDWELVATAQRNRLQQLASKTSGIVTPGNVFTIGGFAIVVFGLLEIYWQRYWLGIAIIIVGRLCDIIDGWIAEKTGTKSPLGEALDAVIDKVAVLVGVIILGLAHTAPWWLLLAVLAPHMLMTVISILTFFFSHHTIHPTRWGKNSMAASWVCLGLLPVLQALHWHGFIRQAVHAVAVICAVTYFVTVLQYIAAELNRR